MLKECIVVFEHQYEKQGDTIFIEDYLFDHGLYVLVDADGSILVKQEVHEDEDLPEEFIEAFKEIDYLSRIISTNKAVDKKKMIHSNNYLSFWVKKQNVLPDKKGNVRLTPEIITGYFDVLANPETKYRKEILPLLEEVNREVGEIDRKTLGQNWEWITQNIYSLITDPKEKNGYLKVFFLASTKKYQAESKRYFVPNVFSYPILMTEMNGQPMGVSSYTLNLNDKKPYFKNFTRKTQVPCYVNAEDAYLYAKFYQYLDIYARKKIYNIYISSNDGIFGLRNEEAPDTYFNGYYLRISRERTGLVIIYSDRVNGYFPEILPLEIKQRLRVDRNRKFSEENYPFVTLQTVNELKCYIDQYIYGKGMLKQLFRDPKEIKYYDPRVRDELVAAMPSFITAFYVGEIRCYWDYFKNHAMAIVYNSIRNDHDYYAFLCFTIFLAMEEYFEEKQEDDFMEMANDLFRMVTEEDVIEIQNDKQYYFIAGQLIDYLNHYYNKNSYAAIHIENALRIKEPVKLRESLTKTFRERMAQLRQNVRFDKLMAAFLLHEPESKKVDERFLIAGYLSANVMYRNRKEEETA
ncbi:hypothetical protein [Eubacterium sp.]|uniref:hypothetical protein n=1 Tax=Eubacterium sp. TaxID=142586 RepID=UPI0026DEE1E6|nr:hypothetical protein [Eubacterium sp.]MDO5432916.1 hypothetical protein [Eubacterium sp.]